MGSGHQQPPVPSVDRCSGYPHEWPNLWDRRACTMHNLTGMPSAPPRRRTVQRPLTWTCGSPGSPTWCNSPSRSGPSGSSWRYTTSGTA